MKFKPAGLRVDIAITNATNEQSSSSSDYRVKKSCRRNHHSRKKSSQYCHDDDDDDDTDQQLESSITTYRAEGLSIGKDYMRFEGSQVSTMASLSPNDLVIEGIIGRGVSSVVKLARYERRHEERVLDRGIDEEDDSKRKHYDHRLNGRHESEKLKTLPSLPLSNETTPIYYALKIFPLSREVNRNDAKPCYFQNRMFDKDGVSNTDDDSIIKAVRRQSELQQRSMLIQEIKTLCILQCECLVHMVGAFYDAGTSVTMILEYMDRGSLSHLLGFDSGSEEDNDCTSMCHYHDNHNDRGGSSGARSPLSTRQLPHRSPLEACDVMVSQSTRKKIIVPEAALASIAYQMLWGLSYLHFEKILHRDIKPANVLVHSSGKVKLGDLGIAGTVACGNTVDVNNNSNASSSLEMSQSGLNHTVIGTTRYMSPERVLDRAYGTPSDIWSFGLVLLECATGGWSPFSIYSENGFDNSMSNDRSSMRGQTHRKGVSSIIDLAMILEEFSIQSVLNELARQSQSSSNVKSSDLGGEVDWNAEVHNGHGLGELLTICLQTNPDARVPADILLESPWFDKYDIHSVEDAASIMQKFLMNIATK